CLQRLQAIKYFLAFLPVSATPTSREPEIPMPDKFDGDCYKFSSTLLESPLPHLNPLPQPDENEQVGRGWEE
uniref:Uncharacterized protein n=1 Tax=Chrysemys picta bellii TaxID=8478 RepID=A0A8C3IDV0_CHRPI